MLYVIMLQGLVNNFHYLLASANLTKYVICEFEFVSVLSHYMATYDTHSFLLLYHNFYVFST